MSEPTESEVREAQYESSRSTALRAAREQRMAEWFGSRRWRLCTELTYEATDISVKQGEFWILNGKLFRTPFGNKGKHGYILQEVNPSTEADIWRGDEPSRASFGWITLKSASDMFPRSIVAVPPRPYGQQGGVAAGRTL